jgi:hypothetical protein
VQLEPQVPVRRADLARGQDLSPEGAAAMMLNPIKKSQKTPIY